MHPLDTADQIARLNKTELEILQGKACGLTYKQIAEKRGNTVNTIKSRLQRIYDKLGYAEAVRQEHNIASCAARAVTVVLRAGKIEGPQKGTLPSFAREDLEILAYVALGYSSMTIGSSIEQKEDYVKYRLASMGRRLNGSSRVYLAALAVVHNLI